MPRPKKDNRAISVRIATPVLFRLNDFCKKSGQTKTTAIERAIEMYIDQYDEDMEKLAALEDK